MANPVIRIGGEPVPNILRFEQRLAFGKHSVCTLDVYYPRRPRRPSNPEIAPEWTPVTVEFPDRPWYGYVHHGGIASDVQDANGSVIRYTFVGTSLPMNEERTRAFRSTSPSAIVRLIASQHRLRTVIAPARNLIEYYGQTGTSDWRVLREMAERTGYRLWVDGSTALFVNPKVLLDGVRDAEIPTYAQNFTPGLVDNLFRFTSKAGTLVPREGGTTRRALTYGMDPRTGTLIKASATTELGLDDGSGPILTTVTSGVTNTVGQAITSSDASSALSAGWITAEAEIRGNPAIVPGSLIRIDGSAVPVDQRGRWLVTSVTHRVLNDSGTGLQPFVTTLTLERDRYRGPSFSTAFRVNNTSRFVPAKIRSGLFWESEVLENVNVD